MKHIHSKTEFQNTLVSSIPVAPDFIVVRAENNDLVKVSRRHRDDYYSYQIDGVHGKSARQFKVLYPSHVFEHSIPYDE